MKRYERILVCIDEPDRDGRMLAYVGAICRAARTRELHLLHVTEPGAGACACDATGVQPMPDVLRSLADQHFKGHGDERIVCEEVSGQPLLELLRYGHEKSVDLIVIGRWSGDGGHMKREAVLARRLTLKATCSVLVLPDNAAPRAKKILVPVRDSDCSANAVDVACGIAAAVGAEVVCLNVFPVRSGYRSVGTTLEEHTGLLGDCAARECEQLLSRVDTQGAIVTHCCLPDLYGHPASIIDEEVKRSSADLIVIGARGRSGAAGVLLGAVTEDLIRRSSVPVMAVKKKGECVTLLQAILSIVS